MWVLLVIQWFKPHLPSPGYPRGSKPIPPRKVTGHWILGRCGCWRQKSNFPATERRASIRISGPAALPHVSHGSVAFSDAAVEPGPDSSPSALLPLRIAHEDCVAQRQFHSSFSEWNSRMLGTKPGGRHLSPRYSLDPHRQLVQLASQVWEYLPCCAV